MQVAVNNDNEVKVIATSNIALSEAGVEVTLTLDDDHQYAEDDSANHLARANRDSQSHHQVREVSSCCYCKSEAVVLA